jgi:hypothetical protein
MLARPPPKPNSPLTTTGSILVNFVLMHLGWGHLINLYLGRNVSGPISLDFGYNLIKETQDMCSELHMEK